MLAPMKHLKPKESEDDGRASFFLTQTGGQGSGAEGQGHEGEAHSDSLRWVRAWL